MTKKSKWQDDPLALVPLALVDVPELATMVEARRVLRIKRTLMYDLVERKEIRSVKVGRLIRIPRSELERLVRGDAEPDVQLRRVK